jgi:hypothetical protein
VRERERATHTHTPHIHTHTRHTYTHTHTHTVLISLLSISHILCTSCSVLLTHFTSSVRHAIGLDTVSSWNQSDKRMETDSKMFKYEAAQILGLHHDDSTRTSPFSSFLSHLDGKVALHYTLQQLLDMGFEISAGVKTPWTPSETNILKQVPHNICVHIAPLFTAPPLLLAPTSSLFSNSLRSVCIGSFANVYGWIARAKLFT